MFISAIFSSAGLRGIVIPSPKKYAKCEPFLKSITDYCASRNLRFGEIRGANSFENPKTPITALRGRFHDYEGIKLMPTYHPAYLLRILRQKSQCGMTCRRL